MLDSVSWLSPTQCDTKLLNCWHWQSSRPNPRLLPTSFLRDALKIYPNRPQHGMDLPGKVERHQRGDWWYASDSATFDQYIIYIYIYDIYVYKLWTSLAAGLVARASGQLGPDLGLSLHRQINEYQYSIAPIAFIDWGYWISIGIHLHVLRFCSCLLLRRKSKVSRTVCFSWFLDFLSPGLNDSGMINLCLESPWKNRYPILPQNGGFPEPFLIAKSLPGTRARYLENHTKHRMISDGCDGTHTHSLPQMWNFGGVVPWKELYCIYLSVVPLCRALFFNIPSSSFIILHHCHIHLPQKYPYDFLSW